MSNAKPLTGETVILTGTKNSSEILEEIERLGGTVAVLPLIKTVELMSGEDESFLKSCNSYDWLIFTSQIGVESFQKKLERFGVSSHEISKPKIAAVGSKTANALEKIGFNVAFIPSIYSADVFVKEFPTVSRPSESCLFLRGSIAKQTIKDGLPNEVVEWTVYETTEEYENVNGMIELMSTKNNLTLTFASPSAVHVFYEKVFPQCSIEAITIAAIGHVTEQALLEVGLPVHVKPTEYTMKALIQQLASRKEVNYD